MTVLDAAETLELIGSLIERTGGPTFKAAAFRKAASTVRLVETDLLRQAAAAGKLKDLPGLGGTTAGVVADVLAGRVPEYLTTLQAQAGDADGDSYTTGFVVPALTGAAAELRAALRGDLHLHTVWSDGGDTLEDMVAAAQALGHDYMVVTDHSPRLRVAHGLDQDRLRHQRARVAALNEELAPFRLLTGVEVDILEPGHLDHPDAVLAACDVVVASVHSRLAEDEAVMTARMVGAVTNPNVDILGHCTGRMVAHKKRAESRFDVDEVFEAIAAHDKALEINCRPERLDPPRRMLARALDIGCRFVISSDAHSSAQLGWQPFGCERAAEMGIRSERVVNTWPIDELLDWAASHSS